MEVEMINKETEIERLEAKIDENPSEPDSEAIDDLNRQIIELQEQVQKYQTEAISLSEKLKFTESELNDEKMRARDSPNAGQGLTLKGIESSRESDDGKEYIARLDIIERRVDQIKNEVGKVMVESFDTLKAVYEQKYQEYIKRVQDKLIESDIKEKGVVNILTELRGLNNDSIRVLKCVTCEDKVWFLIEEDFEVDISKDQEINQYWIRECDLTQDEREYIHQYVPNSGVKDLDETSDTIEINKKIKDYNLTLKDLRDERKDMLKELRDIRFGLKITYYCMDTNFDEDTEQKLYDYDIKFIEYEDDITYLTENLQEQKLAVNSLEIKSKKQEKRIQELNTIITSISKSSNESVERFLTSYKNTNNILHQNQELQHEVNSKNEEIESLKNSSAAGRDHILSPVAAEIDDYRSEDMGKFYIQLQIPIT